MLYEKIGKYCEDGFYPMHMPGHKRNAGFLPQGLSCRFDITEIPGFDDLRDPQGVLRDTADLAAKLYRCRDAFILINGSTVGILAAIGAHTERGDKILTVNNCHWSTPNAAELFGLDVVYINAVVDDISAVPCSVSPDDVADALIKHPDIKLVVITSPTYEGVISDIEGIAAIVHNAGAVLLIDSAHGAHLGFSPDFPENASTSGADIVVISLHKTLPALTQCSLLLACGERANIERIRYLLNILQTSSPSYVLLASADHCLRLLETDGERLFGEYMKNLELFGQRISGLNNLSVIYHNSMPLPCGFFGFDPGKIVIGMSSCGAGNKKAAVSGSLVADKLRKEYKIEVERVNENYIIAMTSICDTREGFIRLADALCDIDRNIISE